MLTSFDKIAKVPVENLRNGEGTVFIQKILQEELPNNCKMYALITIPENCSIGFHYHEGDEEIIFVLKGKAILKTDTEQLNLEAGMVNITKDNECHSIINNNKDDLVIIAMIVKS